MFLRHSSAPRSLSLARLHASQRSHLPLRHSSVHPSQGRPLTNRRLLLTRSESVPWTRKTGPAPLHAPVTHRPLATAVDDSMYPSFTQSASPIPLYHLRAFDPTKTLHVKVQDETSIRARMSPQGVPGGVDEMISVFHACLSVGKLDRAAVVLDRCTTKGDMPPAELLAVHNEYLRARVNHALDNPGSISIDSLQEWFEVQIQGNDLPHNHETIACMLKISLLSARGEYLEKLVTHYLDLLPANSFEPIVNTGILNQQDIGTITSIYQPTSDLGGDDLNSRVETNVAAEVPPTEALPSEIAEEISESESESKPLPEVLPVPQKGLGLKTLRGILSFFNEIEGKDLSKLSVDQRREFQGRLEKDCVEGAIQRWREEQQALAKLGQSTLTSTHPLNFQLYDWHCSLEKRLKADFALFDESEIREKKSVDDVERCIYAPFMRQSTPTRLAAVTIMSVLNNLAQQGADKGIPLSTLLHNLSKIVEDDIKYQARHREAAARTAKYRKARRQQQQQRQQTDSAHAPGPTTGETLRATEPTTTETDSHILDPPKYDTTSWPALIKSKVGAQLLSALIDSAKIKVVREHPETKMIVSQMQPALARSTIHRKGKKVGVIMPNKFLIDLMKREPRGDFLARHLPMLVEPQPWTKFDRGGFIEFTSHLVRVKNGEKDQRIYAEAAFDRGDLDQVCKGLDVLGRTAWRINRPVFEVMLEAWNSGEQIANIPPLNPDLPVPEEPDNSDDPTVRRDWLRRVKIVENEKSGLHSERCFMNFQLDIARAFRDQTFYFPHNMDFRGRAYPIPAYLNHMGADNVRGILRFAKGKELGENGLRWLKVHLANVFGYDKASLEEREAFATDHFDDIADSVANPLTGRRWWLEAEDPWQCLAVCFELKAALDSPDPKKFVSHLPVHQDGTCNGLQHYAALGGDRWGAEQVNLLPSDRPADVYSAVAELVKEQIAVDVADGNIIAKAVDGKISRKIVKQTVMTNVYGVTFMGAKAQVLKQLEALYPKIENETGINVHFLAVYIASKIFKALSTMFRGAHDIQYWLGECAGRVCRALTPEQLDRIAAEGVAASTAKPKKSKAKKEEPDPTAEDSDAPKPKAKKFTSQIKKKTKKGLTMDDILSQFRSTIVWTTPLRMPIVQPYRKSYSRVIATCLQDLTLQVPERSDPVNRRKQLQGFPPNFIHSLDASHMILSALECDELGLSFAAVHDSFWTHAADIDVMNRVLRDAFIRIHSEDVIGRLAAEFDARYKGSLYLARAPKGGEVDKAIMAWRIKHRVGMLEELLQENTRQKLLASSDPQEVEEGRAMVTPASIFEQYSSTVQLKSNEEMEAVVLGNITSEANEADDADDAGEASEADEADKIQDAHEAEGSSEASGNFPTDFQPAEVLEQTEKMKKLMSVTHFEATFKQMTAASTRKTKRTEYFQFWLPLTFPPIPSKGTFDIKELKSSKYFFS